MKKVDKIDLYDLLKNLQAIKKYDYPANALRVLLYGFFVHKSRAANRKRSAANSLKKVYKTADMPYSTAKQFADYCGYDIVPKH